MALGVASAVVLAALVPATAWAECPPQHRADRLNQRPESLIPCRDEQNPIDRSWAAHALAAMGRKEEAAALAASIEGLPGALGPLMRLSAATWALAAQRPLEEARRWAPATSDLPDRRWARRRSLGVAGEMALRAKDWEAARAVVADAERHKIDGLEFAAIAWEAARNADDPKQVERVLTQLRTDWAGTELAQKAEAQAGMSHRIVKLGPKKLAQRWSAWIARGGADGVANECLPLVDRLSGRDLAWARFECGRAHATMRRPEAEKLLEQATRSDRLEPQALLAIARVRSRTGEPEPVVATCARMPERRSARAEAADCAFLAGFMQLNHDEREAGREALEAMAGAYPRHPRAEDARWLLVFDDLHRDPASARARLERLVANADDAQEKARALYWRGRARFSEDPSGAASDWRQAVQADPLGYYGWLAWLRTAPAAEAPRPALTDAPEQPATVPHGAELAKALLDAGFLDESSAELAETLPTRRSDALDWVPFLKGARRFDSILKIGLARGGQGVPWPPSTEQRRAAEAAYPLAFPEEIARLPADVDPHFLLGIMRRESRYDPSATSGARARGLMQLLPGTAAQVAVELGETAPTDHGLHDPATNTRLAAHYLARLSTRFGHPFAVAAAYNAGPESAARWARESAELEADEWVEKIPYRETRAYVKAVAGAWAAYGLLYAGRRPTVSLEKLPIPGAGVEY